ELRGGVRHPCLSTGPPIPAAPRRRMPSPGATGRAPKDTALRMRGRRPLARPATTRHPRSIGGPMLEELDDRRLLVELQSLGVRVVEEDADAAPTRRGGAGPSDALFLWVRGLPLTVPAHADFVDASPYTLRKDGRKSSLYRDDEYVGPVTVPRRP